LKILLWCLCFLFTYWVIASFYRIKHCTYSNDDSYDSARHDDLASHVKKIYKVPFNIKRNLPIIFIVGIKGSGLGLMKNMLNEVSTLECKENNLISEFIINSLGWTQHKVERERLRHASISEELISSASSQFVLELIGKTRGQQYACFKELRLLDKMNYLKKLFPKMKLIFMMRDPRANLDLIDDNQNSFVTANKPTSEIKNYENALAIWNNKMKQAYGDCEQLDCLKGKNIIFISLYRRESEFIRRPCP
jgi:hypothetical protein